MRIEHYRDMRDEKQTIPGLCGLLILVNICYKVKIFYSEDQEFT